MPLIIYAQIQPEPLSHALPTFRTIADSYIRTLLLHFYMFVVPPKLITSKYSLIKIKCVLLVVPAVLLSVVCLLLHSFSHEELIFWAGGRRETCVGHKIGTLQLFKHVLDAFDRQNSFMTIQRMTNNTKIYACDV